MQLLTSFIFICYSEEDWQHYMSILKSTEARLFECINGSSARFLKHTYLSFVASHNGSNVDINILGSTADVLQGHLDSVLECLAKILQLASYGDEWCDGDIICRKMRTVVSQTNDLLCVVMCGLDKLHILHSQGTLQYKTIDITL